MSDFFARLGERALGLRPTLEPRLPGWFGPLRDAAPEHAEGAVRQAPIVPAAATLASPRRTTRADDEPARPAHEHAPRRTEDERGEPASPAMPARSMDGERAARLPLRAPVRTAGDAIDAMPDEPAGSHVVNAPSFAPLVSDRGGHRLPAPDAPANLAQGAIDAAASLRRDAAPNVRVMIGRVEVRANLRADLHAGAPRQARPPQEPRQSLADYLRNGSGGPNGSGGRRDSGGRNGSGGRE